MCAGELFDQDAMHCAARVAQQLHWLPHLMPPDTISSAALPTFSPEAMVIDTPQSCSQHFSAHRVTVRRVLGHCGTTVARHTWDVHTGAVLPISPTLWSLCSRWMMESQLASCARGATTGVARRPIAQTRHPVSDVRVRVLVLACGISAVTDTAQLTSVDARSDINSMEHLLQNTERHRLCELWSKTLADLDVQLVLCRGVVDNGVQQYLYDHLHVLCIGNITEAEAERASLTACAPYGSDLQYLLPYHVGVSTVRFEEGLFGSLRSQSA